MRTSSRFSLVSGVLLAVALPLSGLAGASYPGQPPGTARVGSDRDCLRGLDGLDLQTVTVPELEAALAEGRTTTHRLVETYLARIARYNGSQDKAGSLNAIRALAPDALAQADVLDAERAAGHLRGPLHGLPVLLKDNVGTTDLPTTAGSIALEGAIPKREATLTSRLKAAGALVLGKANLSEFANWVQLGMPNGYSSLGGQVVNPYNDGDPLGSSSGSGVGATMAFAVGAVGSETSGSILAPSTVNSLVGVKPTVGLVSRAGVIPLAGSYDTAGPMARSVTDAAYLLDALAGGPDPLDAATAASAGHVPTVGGYEAGLTRHALDGVRLGYSSSDRPGGTAGTVFDQAIADLTAAGATMVNVSDLPRTANVGLAEIGTIPDEFKAGLNAYLATETVAPTGVKDLTDIILFNNDHPDRVKYGQNLLIASDATAGVQQASGAPAAIAAARAAIEASFLNNDIAGYVGPGYSYANIGAAAGYPSVTVPSGYNGRTPVSVTFLGRPWTEKTLLGYAYDFEQVRPRRVAPTVLNPARFPGC